MYPFIKTFSSFKKANLLGLMLLCAVLAVVIVAGAIVGITWITAHLVSIERSWLDTLINWVAGILTGVGGWFMLPVLTVLLAGLFQETVIQRVDSLYYPDAKPHANLKFWPEIWHDIKFTAWALFLNLLVLPFYLFGIGFLISILLNSYLLGQEFFEAAAGYHIGKERAKELSKRYRRIIYTGGFVITVMTLLPLLNLIVPVFAVVWMVHVYHSICNIKKR
jgi:CysZ protein